MLCWAKSQESHHVKGRFRATFRCGCLANYSTCLWQQQWHLLKLLEWRLLLMLHGEQQLDAGCLFLPVHRWFLFSDQQSSPSQKTSVTSQNAPQLVYGEPWSGDCIYWYSLVSGCCNLKVAVTGQKRYLYLTVSFVVPPNR